VGASLALACLPACLPARFNFLAAEEQPGPTRRGGGMRNVADQDCKTTDGITNENRVLAED